VEISIVTVDDDYEIGNAVGGDEEKSGKKIEVVGCHP